MQNLPSKIFLVALGFTCGWVAHSVWFDKQIHIPSITLSKPQVTLPKVVNTPKVDAALPLIGRSQWQENATARSYDSTQPQKKTLEKNILKEFQNLLDKRAYDEAIYLYQQTNDENHRKEMKIALKGTLVSYMETNRNNDFTSLANAYLSLYYDDVSILLLLAQFNYRNDFYSEAIGTYQLALSYAQKRADRERITEALTEFIRRYDSRLSSQENWIDLEYFYQRLASAGLMKPRYSLRLAEVYLGLNDTESSRIILEQVVNNLSAPQHVRDRASSMLAGVDTGDVKPRSFTSVIPLIRRGNHYQLNAVFGEGLKLNLMIDTGASLTTIPRNRFRKLQESVDMEYKTTRLFNTANGVARGDIYEVSRFAIGDYVLQNIEISVMGPSDKDDFDGLLGMNILSKFRFEIDQDKSELLLEKR